MSAETALTHTVQALNLSAESENRIHDDAVARRFGFEGGLVPGVEVYAYMMNPVVRHFGPEWLDRGEADCRLLKPVYDGREAVACATPESDGGLALAVESAGVTCARGSASMPERGATPEHAPLPAAPVFPGRPPASPETLPEGTVLGTFTESMEPDLMTDYLSGARETLGIYAAERIVHPGWILRLANRALTENVTLGPWMHVGSTVRNFGRARWGDVLQARSRVVRNYEHKGHLFVDLDVAVLREDGAPLSRIAHLSIYRPRQVAEAA